VATAFLEKKHNIDISRNGYQIHMFQGGPLYEPYFIAIDNKEQIIISPSKKDSSHTCGRRTGGFSLIHGNMNSEMGVLLRLMSPGDSMEKGKEYDDMISYAASSLSQYLI